LVATARQETEAGPVHKNIYVETEKGRTILAYNMTQWPPGSGVGSDDGFGITIIDKGEKGMIVV
jgi:galactokinase/mevalonate kinase-like predicted kinase